MPTGRGFADLVFIPKKEFLDVPAMILELKWNQAAETALRQIKEKKYDSILDSYYGNVLLVGINYDKNVKSFDKDDAQYKYSFTRSELGKSSVTDIDLNDFVENIK